MHIDPTPIPGVLVLTPHRRPDERGEFVEAIRFDELERATGTAFRTAQVNHSVSRRDTLRGIHGVTVPPGQEKLVSCVRGAVRDVVVDLRAGSPTFGRHHVTHLDPRAGRSIRVPDGVGHGFLSLADDSCVTYQLSAAHVPGTQVDVDPWDPLLDIPWGIDPGSAIMSTKDRTARSVGDALAAGLLVAWRDDAIRPRTEAPRCPRT